MQTSAADKDAEEIDSHPLETVNTTMDFDELTLKPQLAADIEATETSTGGSVGGSNMDSEKNKPRHYWTPKEEERFFEIWGRDNWRLTRHGKNTVFFASWAKELKERFDIDVKLEEIQAKVNQTRAKFRQVKKQSESDKTAVRWKKFDIIDRILRNQYRSKDAEPLPPEALGNNRDYSSTELNANNTSGTGTRQSTPTSITSNSNTAEDAQQQQHSQLVAVSEQQINVEPNLTSVNISEHNLNNHLYNSSSDGRVNYSSELFSDDIKQEFEDESNMEDYQRDYAYSYQSQQETQSSYVTTPTPVVTQQSQLEEEPEPEPQLHQLQTPQQQQQLQQHFQYGAHADALPQSNITVLPVANAATASNSYEHTSNAYSAVAGQNHGIMVNNQNQNHYSNNSSNNNNSVPNPTPTVGIAQQYSNHNSNNTYTNLSTSSAGNNSMQPPRPTPQPRKRRAPSISASPGNYAGVASTTVPQTTDNAIELMYMEEVRKKNLILEEHKEIERKRLQVEERKVTLMEHFFPKYLELQEQILQKLHNA